MTGSPPQIERLFLPGEGWEILSLYLLLSLDGEAPYQATPWVGTGELFGAFSEGDREQAMTVLRLLQDRSHQ